MESNTETVDAMPDGWLNYKKGRVKLNKLGGIIWEEDSKWELVYFQKHFGITWGQIYTNVAT